MKKLMILFVAAMLSASMMANEEAGTSTNKLAFVVGGPEQSYNQVRVVNHTSVADFQCRVVFLNDDNTVKEQYGLFYLNGYDDSDSNSIGVRRGDRLGIQMPNDFPKDVTFTIEYKDYPFYDAILIYVNDQSSGYDDTF